MVRFLIFLRTKLKVSLEDRIMSSQILDIDIENGTSLGMPSDILSEVGANTLAGAYISRYMPGTQGKLSWAGLNSWACGLNGQTLAFSAADFIAKLPGPFAEIGIRENNQKAIALLEEWFLSPDDLGSAFWEKFDNELEANKFTI